MIRFITRGLITLSLLFLIAAPAAAQIATDASAVETIDAILMRIAEAGSFSGTVLVARGEDVLLEQGYGYAIAEWEINSTAETVYRIGSITKQFTGMAILKFQEEGLLSVDDPICTWLEDCPETWSAITIFHLLTHTSGIPSYTDNPATFNQLMFSNVSAAKVIDSFIDLPLSFDPGTDWAYSNSGYHLLGDIVAAVADTRYRRYLQETFFEPLGMTSTDLERNTALIPRMAEGYSNATTRANYINMNIPYSAGALVSTVGDLFKWQRALLTGQIVSQESLDTMWERAIDVEDFGSKYGYGLFRMTMNGQEVIGHGGGINGFVSYLINLPAHDISIIVLSNREDAALDSILALVIDNLVPVSSG